MDFGIFLDFLIRPGESHTDAFREALSLVDLAEATGTSDRSLDPI
jgi:hypothetical protein